ncbi:Asp23/Gls24 family envelope stress response protein [Streptomyces qinglanensis]|uniref:Asp23 family, cell envelope-related function n=1 Tax=Streptomyces qinglanensis TaxID=943816 RepID=A0A1H9PJU8_9ACTN|nr:Asp23/Gls24 family envelope stress response protein [Streptomyces qinglanensis]SER48492.1 Asp23 family, cell envelope-related function [Streptomyces qinglanensis]
MSQHAVLSEDLAAAVRDVPGVAFLTPGITRRLRSALTGSESASPAGLRVSRPAGEGAPWRIDVRIVTSAEARAVDVARAASAAVTARLTETHPADTARVTVTVTGIV